MSQRIARTVVATTLVLAAVLAPELARACAVCGAVGDEDGSRVAYITTTVILSALPLCLLGGFALWIRRLHRQQARKEMRPSA
ncbi:MAG: hypothetical protein ABFS41_01155 [Myxococcota bacterium]